MTKTILKTRSIKIQPIFGFGYWKDIFKEETGFNGHSHNFVLPFVRIQYGELEKFNKTHDQSPSVIDNNFSEDDHPVFNQSISSLVSEFEKIARETPYPILDIFDFIKISGINHASAAVLLNQFHKAGISNLRDVISLMNIGYFYYK